MSCGICHTGQITRLHKKVICNTCYRAICIHCEQPIFYRQSARKTDKGMMHLGVCPKRPGEKPAESQWQQIELPITA